MFGQINLQVMWTCPLCSRPFKQTNQQHYCGDRTVGDFLKGKSDVSLALFDQLLVKLAEIGPIQLHATKSMIVLSAVTRFAFVINLGRNFVDIVLPFSEPYYDNLCFRKIGQVPGSNQYNHHLRIMFAEDLNEEVLGYLQKAYANGKNV